jgi:DNA-binding MarR family transcriptional regulator
LQSGAPGGKRADMTESSPASRPAHFDPRGWPFFWMTQAVGRYLRKLEQHLKREGLDVARWRVLMSVGNRQLGVSEIADLAIVKLPTMLKLIQRMEADGLVQCAPRASDARYTDVSLTPAGQEACDRAWTVANAIYKTVFHDIPAEDEAHLNDVLKRVFERLG